MWRVYLSLLVVIALGRAAHAQIVDVQSMIGQDVKDGPSGKLDTSVDWRTGNTRRLRVAGAVVARWRAGDHLVFGIARGEYGRSAGVAPAVQVTDASRDFEHLRYRWQATTRLAPEAFAQHEADRFRRLRSRALAGAGLRVRVTQSAQWSVHVGAAVMLEYEWLTRDDLPDAGTATTDARLSTYAVALWKLNDDVGASETIYVQPRLDAPRDIRLLEEAALTAKLAKQVAFRFALVIARDSRPPPGTAKMDTGLQSGLQVEF
ncbi:MAG: DUF481 domain-containing protein [Deltaproteobacteria bacterium]|nr:DUF481 domain-containing protein [Deltaproteobacteria bacterium]